MKARSLVYWMAGTLVALAGLSLMPACGGDDDDDDDDGSSCTEECPNGDECAQQVCNCTDGAIINAASCSDGCCDSKSTTCTSACESNGGWSG